MQIMSKRDDEKQHINNPAFTNYMYQMFVYVVIICIGYKICSLYTISCIDVLTNVKFGLLIIIVYGISCFWTNKMIICDKNIVVIYPTRLLCRKYTLTYESINKIMFSTKGIGTSRFVIYTKKGRINHVIESGTIRDIKKTIQFFQNKGVCIEFHWANQDDRGKYMS